MLFCENAGTRPGREEWLMKRDRVRFHKVTPKEQKIIVQTIRRILINEQNIIFAFIHGSFMESDLFRDIDIGVYLNKVIPEAILELEFGLSNRIEEALPRSIPAEVKVINNSPLSYKFKVSQGLLIFTRNEETFGPFY